MQITQARYFTCSKCGEREEVHPGLPHDYMPNVCNVCWPDVRRGHQVDSFSLIGKAIKLLRACGAMTADDRETKP